MIFIRHDSAKKQEDRNDHVSYKKKKNSDYGGQTIVHKKQVIWLHLLY